MPLSLNLFLYLIVGAAAPALPQAANWQVMLWTDPLVVSVDAASIRESASRITARVMWNYAAIQQTRDASRQPFRSMIGLLVFDCRTDRYGGAGGISYSEGGGAGDVVSEYAIRPDDATLMDPSPGTVAQDLLAYVCAQARNGT